MSKDPINELAGLFKDRENPDVKTGILGVVVSDFPGLKIAIENGKVILSSKRLVLSESLLNSYQRHNTATGQIQINEGSWQSVNLNITDRWDSYGLITGDEVILIPSADGQIYFVMDKAVRL